MAERDREGDDERRDLTSGDPLGGSEPSGAESAFGEEPPPTAESAFGREPGSDDPSGGAVSGGWLPPSGPSEQSGGWAPPSGPSEQSGGWAPPSGGETSGGWAPPGGGAPTSGGWQAPQQQGGGWGPPPQQQGQWGSPQVIPNSSNGKATAALVLGIVGIIFCPIIASIPAIVLGLQARKEIDESQGRQTNRGVAVAGIVTGWIGVVFGVVIVALIVLGVLVGETEGGDVDSEPVGVPAVLLARALLAVPGL